MARNVSAIVSGAGFTSAFWIALDRERKNRGISDKAFYNAMKDDSTLIAKFADLIAGIPKTTFQVWKTLLIGGKGKDQLIQELKDAGNTISKRAHDIMENSAFKTSAEAHEVSFAEMTVRELGFSDPDNLPTTVQIWSRIKELGELCEPEDALYHRLHDKGQERGTWYWIAMEPITDSGGHPLVFIVERFAGGERWLDTDYANPGHRWDLDFTFVFRLRK